MLDQLIHQELVYYQETKEILGKHPIFKEDVVKREVSLLSQLEAYKAYKNSIIKLSRLRKKLKNARGKNTKQSLELKIKDELFRRDLLKAKQDEK